ncbi:ABC transporter permease [uncultured Corynebacterium sp.]|uniref:ABC transporter permease n=1 Tax=uncultured Corynebacterium sp. TaxID=159447 RepID=UPI0025EA8FCB|nr:ABC transporter permease [uncultured Corynebacterium sp.]
MSNWFGDVAAVTSRNFSRLRRSPDVIGFALFQPVMFVLLFSQVYGGAIEVPGSNYTEFLMAGIFAQTVVFGSTFSGTFMAQDLKEGIIDRFRTLPMSQSAVLFARTFTDLAVNAVSMVVMLVAGLAVGWRFHEGFWKFLAGVALLLFFAWAFSWVLVFVGMVVSTPETLNNAVFIILFPLTFISNAFVPSETLPTVLRVIAEWNPVSALVQAARSLFGNLPEGPTPDVWTMQHPILAVLAGSVLIAAVFVPLSIARFRRRE